MSGLQMHWVNLRVVIISYHFPPDAAIGGIRPYQFARLLPQYGVDTYVLTVLPEHAERWDPSFQPEGISPERIVRTAVMPSRRDKYLQITAPLRAWKRRLVSQPVGQTASSTTVSDSSANRFWRCFVEWLNYPDWYGGWYRPALKTAEQMFQQERFSAVFSTSPPRTAALIAYAVARRYCVPWIMDLRDPWMDYSEGWGTIQCRFFQMWHRRVFASCVQQAHAVVVNTLPFAARLQTEYPLCAGKVYVVPNGIDDSISVSQPEEMSSQRMVIAHFGTVYGARTARPFLEGVARWLQRTPEARATMDIWFYGESAEDIAGFAKLFNLSEVVSVHPAVSRQEVSSLMKQSVVLLLLAQKQPLQIPGKTYEYLASGKPIIAMTEHDSATGMLLRNAPECYIAEGPREVEQALSALWNRFHQTEPLWTNRQEFLAPFRYSSLTQQLATIVEKVVAVDKGVT